MPRSYRKFIIAFAVAWLAICIFIFSMTMNNTISVSAVEANGVGVYWDSNCRNRVSSIEWGTLRPGSAKNVAVYIRNEGEKPTYLVLSTKNWYPQKAFQYLNVGWDYSEHRMKPGETLQIMLTLSVSRYIEGISSFSFDILITASSLPGDINGDGIINILDMLIAAVAFGSETGEPEWNQNADLNNDGLINIFDLMIVAKNFGKIES